MERNAQVAVFTGIPAVESAHIHHEVGGDLALSGTLGTDHFAVLEHIHTLPAGEHVSYGATYTTAEPRVIATVPVGYGDGYPRSLSNKGCVLIHGRRAPIVGRVCMDQLMVDVSGIPMKFSSYPSGHTP